MKTDQYVFFKRMNLAINNRKWLLKMYVLKKNNSKEEESTKWGTKGLCGRGARAGQRDILYSIEQIQGNTGTGFKIEYSKKHLYTEHLSSAYYVLVSKIAC